MTSNNSPAPTEQLFQLMSGFWLSKLACLVTKLGIPDLIKDGTVPVSELAEKVGADERTLYRVLRALTCVGVFDEVSPRTFANSAMSHCLREDAPQSLKSLFVLTGEDWKWDSWGKIEKIVRQGRFVLDEVAGYESIFEFFKEEPERGAIFNRAMSEHAVAVHAASIDAYDFSQTKNVVDVGGGEGTFIISLLKQHAHLTGLVYDEAHVVEKAQRAIDQAGLSDRASTAGGSFFDHVPAGGDLYTFGMIMHDWSDAECMKILTNTRQVMAPSSRLVLLEYAVPDGSEPHFAKILDVEMLITYRDGRERTEKEFEVLFAAAGLQLTRAIPTVCGSSVIEATPK
ncbi:MAG: methyltransferase [Pseudomonadota bacterium]